MANNYTLKIGSRDNLERMVKRFIKKTKKLGIIDEARERRHYKKPSEKKREAKRRAIARHKKEEAKRRKEN
jgi:ribosomal protein S21